MRGVIHQAPTVRVAAPLEFERAQKIRELRLGVSRSGLVHTVPLQVVEMNLPSDPMLRQGRQKGSPFASPLT